MLTIPVNILTLTVLKTTSVLQGLFFVQNPPRELTDEEKGLLRKVYGKSVDVNAIRVVEGGSGLLNLGNEAITIGNTIHVAAGHKLTSSLLAHEATHVWQYQRGGNDYLLQALWAQQLGEGYNIQPAMARGDSWRKLNPEQQARVIELAIPSGYFHDGTPPTGVSKAQMDAFAADIKAGRGAGE